MPRRSASEPPNSCDPPRAYAVSTRIVNLRTKQIIITWSIEYYLCRHDVDKMNYSRRKRWQHWLHAYQGAMEIAVKTIQYDTRCTRRSWARVVFKWSPSQMHCGHPYTHNPMFCAKSMSSSRFHSNHNSCSGRLLRTFFLVSALCGGAASRW